MSDTESGRERDDPETTTLNLRVTESFLDDIDAAWKEEGYTSRSEFLRHAIRDAVQHPGLSRSALATIAAEEFAMRNDESEAVSREEVLDLMDDE
jgi:Arc/MetJ-type ribon-helix-helix transcriptional regulator